MQPGHHRIDLSVGYERSRTGRLVSLAVLAPLLVVTCGCVGAMIGQFTRFQGGPAAITGIAALVLGGGAALLMGLLLTTVVRTGASLTGPYLTVTRLSSRTVDLRAATSITIHAATDTQTGVGADGSIVALPGNTRTPVLTVVTPARTVGLRLRSLDGALIPARQMVAVADALTWAHCPGAREAEHWLRVMAADPRTMLL
ncbi:hypothetical protein [Micromonospora sp. SH-82]|uniref:hypothetical protein n=1 Tax=Micromonospora sp. SH-82 TaxID=3132938 RepID=UPI003EBCF6DC